MGTKQDRAQAIAWDRALADRSSLCTAPVADAARHLEMNPLYLALFLQDGMLLRLLKCAVVLCSFFTNDADATPLLKHKDALLSTIGANQDLTKVVALVFTREEQDYLVDALCRVPSMTLRGWREKFSEDVTREEKTV